MITNKMLLLFLLIWSTFAVEGRVLICDGLIFHNVYYEKITLYGEIGRPYSLIMHKFSGILFFSHTTFNGTHVDFLISGCHVKKNDCFIINGIPGGYAIAYDKGNDDIYFGGHDGIYKYNFMTKSAELFGEEGKSIWGLFIKANFYYIEYPTQKLYVFQEDSFVKVAEAENFEVDHFFISKHEDVYFSNKTALYKIDHYSRDIILLNDEITVRQITEDKYGDVYFLAENGIYLEEKPYRTLSHVAKIDQAFGMAFDGSDNVIYSNEANIYKLLPSKYNEACYKAFNAPEENRGYGP